MPDRRIDEATRRRVDELASSWENSTRLLDLRYRRVVWLSLGGIMVTLVCVVAGFLLLQGQRWQQVRDGCERTNQQTEATVGLLEDLRARPASVALARRRFPHVPPLVHAPGAAYDGPMTCGDFADERVRGPRL